MRLFWLVARIIRDPFNVSRLVESPVSTRHAFSALTALAVFTACATATPRRAPIDDAPGMVATADADVETLLEPDAAPPSVVARTYKGSPYVNVLAWAGDEARFGLRSSVRQDGGLARGFHSLFMSTETARQLSLKYGGGWSIFPISSDAERGKGVARGRIFKTTAVFSDVHSCEGSEGCTPFVVATARLEDELLRRSAATGLEVRVYGRTANAYTVVTLSPAVVSAYLTTYDSVTTARRAVAQR